jgi:predicted kinase
MATYDAVRAWGRLGSLVGCRAVQGAPAEVPSARRATDCECGQDRFARAGGGQARSTDPSDATIAVASAIAATADPWPAAITVQTTDTISESLARAVRSWDHAISP